MPTIVWVWLISKRSVRDLMNGMQLLRYCAAADVGERLSVTCGDRAGVGSCAPRRSLGRRDRLALGQRDERRLRDQELDPVAGCRRVEGRLNFAPSSRS